MKRYTIRIRGEDYQIDLEGRATRVGFYTVRFVNAENATSAEALALKSVTDAIEPVAQEESGSAGRLFVEDVEELEGTDPDADEVTRSGFVYFRE